jgi:hypothetical protein
MRFALAANSLDKLARFFLNSPDMKKSIPPVLITLSLVCLALSPAVQAVNPAPDGAYAGANTAEGGAGVLFSLTTGTNNTALGSQALFSLTTGVQNTATGAQALKNNIADKNTADGFQALVKNTTGGQNTATGWRALFQNTTGESNTANGANALYSNTDGFGNTATGWFALSSNSTGGDNTANGGSALSNNTTGDNNTATGAGALSGNTTGFGNTATGFFALSALFSGSVTGNQNTADGDEALFNDQTGSSNTANGSGALFSNTTGNNNIALGANAGDNLTTGDNNINIGNQGVADEGNTIRVGIQGTQTKTFIAGISGTTVTGTAVVVNGSGQLGVAPSSARFKDEIEPMDKASEAVLALKPVTFHYKKDIDPKGIPQFGLVAEEVEKINPELVVRDKDGKPYTVRYDAVNAMLLNEFLKEHKAFVEEQHKVHTLEATVASLVTTVKDQAAQIQKVSAQLAAASPSRGGLELSKFAAGGIRGGGPAPQVVNNP